ncbi:unnamed protein product [Scytosiphon promiscuus]
MPSLLILPTVRSGGAMFHHAGYASLTDTNFTGNMAGSEGLAVITFGDLDIPSFPDSERVFFADNSFFCPLGQYGFDKVRPCKGWVDFPSKMMSIGQLLACLRLLKSGRKLAWSRQFLGAPI